MQVPGEELLVGTFDSRHLPGGDRRKIVTGGWEDVVPCAHCGDYTTGCKIVSDRRFWCALSAAWKGQCRRYCSVGQCNPVDAEGELLCALIGDEYAESRYGLGAVKAGAFGGFAKAGYWY